MKTTVAIPNVSFPLQTILTKTQMSMCEGCGSPIVKIAQLTSVEVEMGGEKLEVLQSPSYISSWMHALTQDTNCDEPMNVETSERGNPPSETE